jgi:hypothetical protein
MRKIYSRLFGIVLAMLIFATDGFSQTPILFVGRDDLGYWQSDQDLFDSLTAWGYAPEFWDSNTDYTTGIGLDYNNYEAMLANETVDSKVMGKHAEDGYPLPCIMLEGFAVATGSDRWEWIDDNTTELYQTPGGSGTADDQIFVVKDNSHYITEEYQVGDQIPWSSATDPSVLTEICPISIKEVNVDYDGKLGQMKSHESQAGFWNMVSVDDVAGNGNRLLYWGINSNGLNGLEAVGGAPEHYGTPAFFHLIKRSVEWVLGAGPAVAVEEFRSSPFELVAFPNPASERLTVRFRATAGADATATLYNVAGQAMDAFTRMTVDGNNFLFLDAGNYPAGIYHLHLDVDGQAAVTKVVIQ